MLRAVTRSVGTRDSLEIRLSVMPSLRYSLSGSPLPFTNGSTATESIAPCDAERYRNMPRRRHQRDSTRADGRDRRPAPRWVDP